MKIGIRQSQILLVIVILPIALPLADDPNYKDDPYGVLAKQIAEKHARGEMTGLEEAKALDNMGMVYDADEKGEMVLVKPHQDKSHGTKDTIN